MDIFLQQLINGLVLGSVYALVALGYTMVYGVLGLINFAHGEILMLGAMISLSVMKFLLGLLPGSPPFVLLIFGVLTAVPATILISLIIERVAYRPLRHAPKLAPLITAIGVSITLQTLAMIVWSRNYHVYPALFSTEPLHIAGAVISQTQLCMLFISGLLMLGLTLLINRTNLGRAMRATSENYRMANLMGINPDKIIATTFAIGAGLAAVAGIMVAANYSIAHFYMGFILGLKAFTAAVLGGIGNIAGAMLGGLLLGLIESLGAGYIGDLTGGVFGSNYQDVFAFIVLIMVLIFKPSGLMGERVSDRA
jgi:branched-chain amino acid transport system permease protein